MCDIASLRNEIDAFLNALVEARDERDLESVRELAIERLTSEFDDKCPDQCIRTRVDSFFEAMGATATAAQ